MRDDSTDGSMTVVEAFVVGRVLASLEASSTSMWSLASLCPPMVGCALPRKVLSYL